MIKPLPNTAIVHDVFVEFGGAERVLLELVVMYPTADIFIPLLHPSKRRLLEKYSQGNIHTSWLNQIPFVHSASILLKPLLYLYWQYLDLSTYKLVLSSSHSFSSKGVITGPGTYHLSYVHTPPRYLYVEYNETRILRFPFWRALLTPLLSWLRLHDFIAAQRPDLLVANSRCVADRIAKYYRRSAPIVYPPITQISTTRLLQTRRQWQKTWQHLIVANCKPNQISIFQSLSPKQYYVAFSRLSKQKGIDLAVKACGMLQRPLIVVGEGGQASYLHSIAGITTLFVGAVSDEQKTILLSQAKALLYCSIEEDFGMVTAEALAHGLPVIGYNSGGTTEIVTPAVGVLFDEHTVESLQSAIKKFERRRFSVQACRRRAKEFASVRFVGTIKKLIAKRKRA